MIRNGFYYALKCCLQVKIASPPASRNAHEPMGISPSSPLSLNATAPTTSKQPMTKAMNLLLCFEMRRINPSRLYFWI